MKRSRSKFNLRFLDLSHNLLTTVPFSFLKPMPFLRVLKIRQNPFDTLSNDLSTINSKLNILVSIHHLDISDVYMAENSWTDILFRSSVIFPNIKTLILTNTSIRDVQETGFKVFTRLQQLDITQTSVVYFDKYVFQSMKELREIHTDNYKLCCKEVLPDNFNPAHCHAPEHALSSCTALLHDVTYRAALSVLASIVLVGNTASFLYRTFLAPSSNRSSFGLLVTSLCLSDLLMGVFLAIIGVVDRVFLGSYIWQDVAWTQSSLCTMAGAIAFASCEISSLIICLITLDRLLVLCFPFKFRLHFTYTSSLIMTILAWVIGVGLAVVPTFFHQDNRVYGQSGLCVPLPITGRTHTYTFAVIIVLNCVLFIFVGVGQTVIYVFLRSR